MTTETVLERNYPGRRAQLKREILAAALGCFNEHGIEATTIDTIKAACETSVGAIYHHFGNKDGLVAALFFCAQDDLSALLKSNLDRAQTQEEGVHAMVLSYLDWVIAEPELARFQFQARSFVARGAHAKALIERNKSRNKMLLTWLTQFGHDHPLSRCPAELLPSLIVGQAENYCRAWLSGRVKTSPRSYRPLLAAAAWSAVMAASE